MGTRGFVGFAAGGTDKITYNHWDSYPNGLGVTVLQWLRDDAVSGSNTLRRAVERLQMVTGATARPTAEQIEQLQKYADLSVGARRIDDWYCLLRETQGNPAEILNAGYAEDASGFPYDSLVCEWGYLIDCDTETFEVYEGFQRERHDAGRFASGPQEGADYYPVALIASWPWSALPSDDDFLAQVADGRADAA